jgi:uncharacterized membrane protein
MRTERTIEIDAPVDVVWRIYSDVEHWPDWTASVTKVEPLDGAPLVVGRRYRIRQPRLPALVWEVSDLDPGVSWRWTQRSPGASVEAWHIVEPTAGGSRVRLGIEQRGLLGALVGRLTAGLTRRYLDLEAEGLKARSERGSAAGG